MLQKTGEGSRGRKERRTKRKIFCSEKNKSTPSLLKKKKKKN